MKDSTLFRGKLDLTHKIKGFRESRPTGRQNAIAIRVVGNNLQHIGILHNDFLLVEPTESYVFGDNKLYLWKTPNGRTAKFVERNNDALTLHNNDAWSQTWRLDEVKCLGVVFTVERDL
jgi:SOS-response transcriptional repressor LexA